MSGDGTAGVVASIRDLRISLERNGVRSEVIRGVDLEVRSGEILGLVGESGSGKSVLALAMMGLLPQRSQPRVDGAIRVVGTDMVAGSAAELRRLRRDELGVIFQDPMTSLNPTMRVGKQITEASGDDATTISLMSAVGISDPELRFRVYPHELSGGLRQRIMAAIAVAGRPSLIIADEPTTALDVTVQAQVLDLLKSLRDDFGCSVVFITHDLAVAAQIADRVAVLYAGRIAEIGRTAEILHRPTHPYTVGLLRSRLSLTTPRDTLLETLRPETATADERARGCAYSSRCPLAVERCSGEQPPLVAAKVPDAADVGGTPGAGAIAHDRACWRSEADVHDYAGHTPAQSLPVVDVTGLVTRPIDSSVPSVSVSGLHARFVLKAGAGRRREVHALRGVDLTVYPGESVSIVGESGSGKSTLLRVIAGLTPAASGTVNLAPGGAQMVFQDAGSSLTPWMTVGETLRERLLPLRLGTAENRKRVDAALATMGLPASIARSKPAELSGGQRQRIALARATIIPPAVLLCDEPTSALDASLAASVLNLIREMRTALTMTVLFVTHDLSVSRLMGDRIVVMTGGEIVETGTTDDVISRPQHPYTRALLGSVPDIGALR